MCESLEKISPAAQSWMACTVKRRKTCKWSMSRKWIADPRGCTRQARISVEVTVAVETAASGQQARGMDMSVGERARESARRVVQSRLHVMMP